MIQANFRLAPQHAVDARCPSNTASPLADRRAAHVNVRHLMIRDGEARDAPQSSISQPSSSGTVRHPCCRKTRLICTGLYTAVIAYSDNTTHLVPGRSALPVITSPPPRHSRESACVRGSSWPEPLEVVIQMRQIDEQQRRTKSLQHFHRRIRDPPRTADVGPRPPEFEQRKDAQPGLQFVASPAGWLYESNTLRPSAG